MKLYIPSVGQHLKLTATWTFTLLWERRNDKYLQKIAPHLSRSSYQHTLLPCTVLKVDRIYIRTGQKGYDSITFRIHGEKNSRFFVKLEDANNIEYELFEVC